MVGIVGTLNFAPVLATSAAEFADTLRGGIRGRENLVRLLVKQPMIVVKMRSRDVPVKVLGLHIQREYMRKQRC